MKTYTAEQIENYPYAIVNGVWSGYRARLPRAHEGDPYAGSLSWARLMVVLSEDGERSERIPRPFMRENWR